MYTVTSPLSEAVDAYTEWGLVGFIEFAESNYNGTVSLFDAARIHAARSLLAGSPIQWCEVHGDWSATLPFDGRKCRWALKVDGTKPCHITSMLLCTPPT